MQDSKKEEKIIESGLKKYGRRAYQDTKSKGFPVTHLQGNYVLEEHSGRVNVVRKIEQTKFKIEQRTFNLDVQ